MNPPGRLVVAAGVDVEKGVGGLGVEVGKSVVMGNVVVAVEVFEVSIEVTVELKPSAGLDVDASGDAGNKEHYEYVCFNTQNGTLQS